MGGLLALSLGSRSLKQVLLRKEKMIKLTVIELEKLYPKIYEFLQNNNMSTLEEKRYELGDGDYVNVESYNTYDFSVRRYESHKKYIDIQYIIIGEEKIVVKPVSDLHLVEEYCDSRDIAFYNNDVIGRDYMLKEGEMLELFPEDGHMPCISINDSVKVKKAVFKIQIK